MGQLKCGLLDIENNKKMPSAIAIEIVIVVLIFLNNER